MANSRYYYDPCRTEKYLQQATDPGRWILNVPGNGTSMPFIDDPYIRMQKWGANLRTNVINLETELRGGMQPLCKNDCMVNNPNQVSSMKVSYPSMKSAYTDQSRASNPAWLYRDLEHNNFEWLPLDPQVNVCLPFQNNISTRIIAKDYYTDNNNNNCRD